MKIHIPRKKKSIWIERLSVFEPRANHIIKIIRTRVKGIKVRTIMGIGIGIGVKSDGDWRRKDEYKDKGSLYVPPGN